MHGSHGRWFLGAAFAFAAGALVSAGCSDKKEAPSAPAASAVAAQPAAAAEVTPAVQKEAEEIFNSRCTPCHGPKGAGDGPASAGLTPPPRNFQDKAWQAQVTDEHIEKIITYGGAAVGKSPAMPPNPDLADKPVVKGLRQHLRGLAAK